MSAFRVQHAECEACGEKIVGRRFRSILALIVCHVGFLWRHRNCQPKQEGRP